MLNKKNSATNGTIGSDFCSIGYTEALEDKPSVMLGCKHFLHFDCLRDKLLCKWVPPKISFQYLKCPACNAEIETDHSELISIIGKNLK